MDQNEMQLVSHFRLLFRKETGDKIDLLQFSNDANYAKGILRTASKTKNDELVAIALKILKSRGLALDERAAGPSETEEDPPSGDKYVGRLR